MVDILSSAKDGANKTKIVYEAYLNFKQAGEYLDFLMESDLLGKSTNENKTIYRTTDKGVKMLERYRDLVELRT